MTNDSRSSFWSVWTPAGLPGMMNELHWLNATGALHGTENWLAN
jgi:hypothetical protein